MSISSKDDLNHLSNLKHIKQQLFNHSAISRAEIARKTDLTRATVSSLFDELDSQNYIKHLGRGKSTENGGRKPELYTINSHYGYIACFNLTYNSLYTIFLYIDGQEISYQRTPINDHQISSVIKIIEQQITHISKFDDTEQGLLGISFSIHAVVDNNRIKHSPYYDLQNIDLQKYFKNLYRIPVHIGNEANLAAIFERDFIKDNSDNFIVLSIHRGPGIGVIANHQLFSGFQGMTGELGSVKVLNSKGKYQELGNIFSSDYLLAHIMQANHCQIKNLEEAHQVVLKNIPSVNSILENFAYNTAQLVFNLQMLYGPEKILINSPIIEALPELGSLIQKYAKKSGIQIPITIIKGSKYVSLLGAGALLIRQVLNLKNVNLQFHWSHHIG